VTEQPHHDDPEDADPGLARQRTRLAWVRTTIAFAALGGAVLKTNIPVGITVLALVPLVGLTGHLSRHSVPGKARPGHLLVTAVAITVVALVVLVMVLLGYGKSLGYHPPLHAQPG
jgi:uncharacterized membrane protein YidH (DUF202 family)